MIFTKVDLEDIFWGLEEEDVFETFESLLSYNMADTLDTFWQDAYGMLWDKVYDCYLSSEEGREEIDDRLQAYGLPAGMDIEDIPNDIWEDINCNDIRPSFDEIDMSPYSVNNEQTRPDILDDVLTDYIKYKKIACYVEFEHPVGIAEEDDITVHFDMLNKDEFVLNSSQLAWTGLI